MNEGLGLCGGASRERDDLESERFLLSPSLSNNAFDVDAPVALRSLGSLGGQCTSTASVLGLHRVWEHWILAYDRRPLYPATVLPY